MTVASAIAALSPSIWYKLDELSGTNAHNSGSQNNEGTYSGSYQQGLTGPEVGTYGTRLFSGGQIVSGPMDLSSFAAQTLAMFVSTDATGAVSTIFPILTIGDVANRLNRGPIIYDSHAAMGTPTFNARYGTSGNSGLAPSRNPTFWHWVVAVYNTGASGVSIYVDGVQSTPLTLGTPVNPVMADPLLIRCDEPVVVAHVCWWGSVLTQAQIQTVSNQIAAWPLTQPINTPPASTGGGGFTDTDRTQLNEVASDTDTLLSNWAGYTSVTLPSLQDMLNSISSKVDGVKTDTSNIVNSLFPQLAAVLNDIGAQLNDVQNAVRGTLQDGASAIVRTVGELLSNLNRDQLSPISLTDGPTCSPINIDISGQRVYGIVLSITAYPEGWKFRTPDQAWSLFDFAVIRIYHHSQLIQRLGVHTLVYTLEPIPQRGLPWLGPLVPLQPDGTIITVDWADGVCGELVATQLSS